MNQSSLQTKARYFLSSARKAIKRNGYSCPSCGENESSLVSRKYLFTELRRCNECALMFRAPTTTPEEQESFYQSEYTSGLTTDLPSTHELERLKQNGFEGTAKDATMYLDILDALGAKTNQRLFDYGCSWGYGSWQFKKEGFEVTGYEVSTPRCTYANKHMEIEAYDSLEEINGPFDIFFSAHVLEHVPSVKESIDLAKKLLRPGGLFLAFTPNGSEPRRQKTPKAWDRAWGLVHPQLLDDQFYHHHFGDTPHLLASSSYDLDQIREWNSSEQESRKLSLTGGELLCAAVFN